MPVAVCLPLIISVIAAVSARRLAEWLPPRTATWLLAGGAVALAVATSAMLSLLVVAAAVRTPVVAAIGHESLRVMNRDDPASPPFGVAAAVLLAAAAVAAAATGWRRVAALLAAHRQARLLPGSGQVVVIADEAVDAYAVPGWPGRIVVTSGMMQALEPAERQVLLAHEQAHATGCHYLFIAAARLASVANPLLRPVAAAVGYSVERWADEQAAEATGDRPLTARALARAALAASAAPPRAAAPASALGVVSDLSGLRRAGVVPRRVAALLRPPPRPRLMLPSVTLLMLAVCAFCLLVAARDLHAVVEYAQAALLPPR